MRCPNCGGETAPNSPFCSNCGSPLVSSSQPTVNQFATNPVAPQPSVMPTYEPPAAMPQYPTPASEPPAQPTPYQTISPMDEGYPRQPRCDQHVYEQQPVVDNYPPPAQMQGYHEAPANGAEQFQGNMQVAAQQPACQSAQTPYAYGAWPPAQHGDAEYPQQPMPTQQQSPRPVQPQYSSLRDAAEALQANNHSNRYEQQPQYYPPAGPAQRNQDTGFGMNSVKTEAANIAGTVVEKARRGLKSKKVLGGIFALAALIVVIFVANIFIGGNGGFTNVKTTISPVIVDGEIRIMVDDKLLDDKIDGDSVHDMSTSMNGKVVAFTNDENTLYVVNDKKVSKVAEDVSSYEVSVSGKGVAYVTVDDDTRSLMLYAVNKNNTTKVTDELSGYTFAISPDGKSVAYYVEGDENNELMFFKGSDAIRITSEEVELLGLSNGGKQIYASREDDDEDVLYVYDTKGEKTKLGKVDPYNAVYFNEKHTEIMFFNDGKTYVATKGKEAVKMLSDEVSMVIPSHAGMVADNSAYTYPVSSLFNHVYIARDDSGANAWLIKKNPDKNVKLASDVSDVTLDKSGKYLYYVHDYEELMVLKVNDGEKASDKAVELAEDVSTYVVTSNRSKVYYVADEELYSVNGKKGGSPKRIADEVDAYNIALNSKNVLFYVSDGDLYACSNGKSGERVLSDCSGVSQSQNGVAYATDGDAVYACKSGKKLSKIAELDD